MAAIEFSHTRLEQNTDWFGGHYSNRPPQLSNPRILLAKTGQLDRVFPGRHDNGRADHEGIGSL